jgi:hypothetical protein
VRLDDGARTTGVRLIELRLVESGLHSGFIFYHRMGGKPSLVDLGNLNLCEKLFARSATFPHN